MLSAGAGLPSFQPLTASFHGHRFHTVLFHDYSTIVISGFRHRQPTFLCVNRLCFLCMLAMVTGKKKYMLALIDRLIDAFGKVMGENVLLNLQLFPTHTAQGHSMGRHRKRDKPTFERDSRSRNEDANEWRQPGSYSLNEIK